jgi:hypothetical protein
MTDAFTPATWWTESGQQVLLTSVGIMIALGTVLEFLLGRTVGKIITGCEVVAVKLTAANPTEAPAPQAEKSKADEQAGPDRVPLWRVFLRNVIKWGLPPVALIGMLDPNGRHRADQLARTAVVIEAPEEDEADDEEP